VKGVEYRNTSKPGDEIFYIVSLLGIDCQLILSKTNVEEKAIAFYLALNTLPLSILFCNGLRIATAPFRWAMRFFLTSNKDDNSIKVDALNRHVISVSTCEVDGLYIEMEGILFKME